MCCTGRVTKAKSPERLPHKGPWSSTGSGCASSASSGAGGGLATWTEADKAELMALVHEARPCGAVEWEDVARRLGAKGGAAAVCFRERGQCLTDDGSTFAPARTSTRSLQQNHMCPLLAALILTRYRHALFATMALMVGCCCCRSACTGR